jgi:hypothetical protein
VPSLEDVARLALALPDVTQFERHGNRTWAVQNQAFAWERPFTKADLRRLGAETPPAGPILAVRTEDLHEKEALLAAHPRALFTISHFDGYPAVLVRLRAVTKKQLAEVLRDGWLATAPEALAREYLATRRI